MVLGRNPHSTTDQQIRDELMTLILAGHETMASTPTWAWCLLSQHPEVCSRMQEEVDSALDGRLPTAEDLPRLRYVTAVFAETMRLYPAIYAFGRTVTENVEIGGYRIPKGSGVSVAQYGLHRDPRFWPDAEQFRPERWLEDDPARPKFAYLPFGAGVRQCLGELRQVERPQERLHQHARRPLVGVLDEHDLPPVRCQRPLPG